MEIDDVLIFVRFSGSYLVDFRFLIRLWRFYFIGLVMIYFIFLFYKIFVKRNDLIFLIIVVYISLIIIFN